MLTLTLTLILTLILISWQVRKWVRELRSIVGNDIAIVIAGNKVDVGMVRA